MNIRIIETDGKKIAVCESESVIIEDGQSALEFVVNIGYGHGCHDIAVNKAALSEDFFKLSNGVAGEVAQKFVNYRYRVAIIGDFSGYTSKPIRDYMYECNQGGHLYFVSDESEALTMLSR